MPANKLLPVSAKLLLFLLVLLLCSGCSTMHSKNTRYYPVKHYTPRQNSLGFSISPPPGSNWYEKLKNNSLIYLKKDQPDTYAIYTQATEIVLEHPIREEQELIDYVMRNKDIDITSGRYRNYRSEYSPQTAPSQQCVRYDSKFEDHGVKNLDKKTFVMVKSSGVFCLHPDTPNVGIDLYYFEKSIAGAENMSYREEGEQFLSSLNFNTVRL